MLDCGLVKPNALAVPSTAATTLGRLHSAKRSYVSPATDGPPLVGKPTRHDLLRQGHRPPAAAAAGAHIAHAVDPAPEKPSDVTEGHPC